MLPKRRIIGKSQGPKPLVPIAIGVCSMFALLCWQANAQGSITVIGAKLGEAPEPAPALSLSDDLLQSQRARSLGETLSLLPGTSHSAFGPHASRPIVRGLDRDRVRIMQAGSTLQDLSAFSSDHAVATDPILIESIEILRGPAALLYGGQASGGAINLIDRRLTRRLSDIPEGGVDGRGRIQAGDQSGDLQYGFILRSALDRLSRPKDHVLSLSEGAVVFHLDAAASKNNDLRTPPFSLRRDDLLTGPFTRIRNSASEQNTTGMGVGWVDRKGHAGLAIDRVTKQYGVTVEEATTIDMQRQSERLEIARDLGGIYDLKALLHYTKSSYRHDEKEEGEVTRFKLDGHDWRSELHFGRKQSLSGVIGIEASHQDFSAIDAEGAFAFVPPNQMRRQAIYGLQRIPFGASEWQFAARLERVRLRSDSHIQTPLDFKPFALSLSYGTKIAQGLSLQASLSNVQRAPAPYELFADGMHHAAGTYERGDSSLGNERGILGDLSLAYQNEDRQLKLSVYQSQFSRYIGLKRDSSLDTTHDDEDGKTVPGYRYVSYAALLQGLEFSGSQRLRLSGSELRPSFQFDILRGVERDTGLNLPRIPPRRAVLSAAWSGEGVIGKRWLIRPEWVLQAAAKPSTEDEISGAARAPAYQLVNLYAQILWRLEAAMLRESILYLQAKNLTNQLAYHATALPNIRDLAPVPGRNLKLGWMIRF